MKFNPEIHHRRSIRLQGYDYSQAGAYFVTICTQNRECLLGEVVAGETQLGAAGKMTQAVWDEIPEHYLGIDVTEFVVMPNHVHGIIVIVGAPPYGCPESERPESGQVRGGHPYDIGAVVVAGCGASVQNDDNQTLCGWR